MYSRLGDHRITCFAWCTIPSPTKYYPQGSGDKKLRVSGLDLDKMPLNVIFKLFFRIDDQFHVKLTDMALSRDFFPNDYHCLGDNENRPIKWMAMESLTRREFSTSSDIVSSLLSRSIKGNMDVKFLLHSSGRLVLFFGKSRRWLSNHMLKLILLKSAESYVMVIDLLSQSTVRMNCKIHRK